jgi:glycogen synthase
MRIAYLTPEYVKDGAYDGGLANYLAKTGHQLSLRGHKVTIFVSSDRNFSWMDGDISVIEFKRVSLAPNKFIGRLNQFLPLLSNLLTCIRFKKKVIQGHRNFHFDLIQVSSYTAPGYALRHNPFFPMVCRVSSYTPQLRSAFGYRRNLDEYLMDWLEIRQTLDADSSFAPSIFLADTYRKLEGFQPKVIRTPLVLESIEEDISLFKENFQKLDYLLYFGTLSQIKGVDLLADIIPNIMDKFPNIYIVFVGRDDGLPGGKKIFDYVLEKCPYHRRKLFYHPPVSKSKLYPIIRHSMGVLMPSRVDNYPNTCLEALSCGVPIIGTNQSSLEEMIIEGQSGFLANNCDSSSIQKAIEKLLNLTDLERSNMREFIFSFVEEIKKEDRVGQLINYYQEVIDDYRQ